MEGTAVPGRLTWQTATVTAARWETPSVRTIELDVPSWPGHRAGQHLDVRLTAEDGYSAERSYSIATAAGEGVAITVERLDDGEVSPYLTDELRVGERVGPLTVVAMPGKSPGEVALHWPERKILIVGDAVIGNPPGRCGLLREQVMDDPARMRESVRSLLTIDFDTLLVGDGVPILRGAKDRLRELVATFA